MTTNVMNQPARVSRSFFLSCGQEVSRANAHEYPSYREIVHMDDLEYDKQVRRVQWRIRNLCRQALHDVAKEHGLRVSILKGGHRIIRGADGYIGEAPYGFEVEGFRVSPSMLKEWDQMFKHGACLSWTHTTPFSTRDNFSPFSVKQTKGVLKHIGLLPKPGAPVTSRGRR